MMFPMYLDDKRVRTKDLLTNSITGNYSEQRIGNRTGKGTGNGKMLIEIKKMRFLINISNNSTAECYRN